jgi:hypothetical protein
MPVTDTGNRATESMSEACPNTFASGTKPSPLMARTGSSRQRNRMPAIEVETDGRETQPAPPRLTHFGPRWVVSLSTSCCRPMVLGLIERRLPPRRAKTGRRNHRDRRYIALPRASPVGVPRTLGRVTGADDCYKGADHFHCMDQSSVKHDGPPPWIVSRTVIQRSPAAGTDAAVSFSGYRHRPMAGRDRMLLQFFQNTNGTTTIGWPD